MARYRAKQNPIYLDLRLVAVGEEFESDLPPGQNWEPLDDAAKRAVAKQFPSGVPPKAKLPGTHDTPAADLPANWRELAWPQQRAIAIKLGAPRNANREAALAVIEREEFNRAADAPDKAAA